SPYRREWLEERVGKARDPDRARRAIEQGYRTYDGHSRELPPEPENWRGIATNPGRQWLVPG
ncbi:hypothetical protein JXB37_00445, partial [candidate division WOR-3 bacterium]|nr:hypothetical protein [candidate division WOR-3 bacterium]